MDDPKRRPAYQRLIAEGFPGGIAIDDGAAVYFRGRSSLMSSRSVRGAQAYRMFQRDGHLVEEPLQARLLG